MHEKLSFRCTLVFQINAQGLISTQLRTQQKVCLINTNGGKIFWFRKLVLNFAITSGFDNPASLWKVRI